MDTKSTTENRRLLKRFCGVFVLNKAVKRNSARRVSEKRGLGDAGGVICARHAWINTLAVIKVYAERRVIVIKIVESVADIHG